MADITIRHDHEDGTILTGSTKGDGVWEIVNQCGFTYRRSVGIFIMGSRDRDAKMHLINAAKEALEDAGHTVTLDIDNQHQTAAEREEARMARVEDRVERLDERSDKAAGRSAAAEDRYHSIADHIPTGQPILIGHHSEGRARADSRRMDNAMRTAVNESNYADSLHDRARGAESNEAHKHTPGAMVRKIEKLKTDVARHRREIDGYTRNFRDSANNVRPEYAEVHAPAGPERAADLRRWIDRDEEEITFLLGKLEDLAVSGDYDPWKREHFQVGDEVFVWRLYWLPVRKVNAKSVTVPDPGIYERDSTTRHTRTIKYADIGGRRRGGTQRARPHGEPISVELAEKVGRWARLRGPALRAQGRDSYSRDTMQVKEALRIVHGLPVTAADAEVAAFGVKGWPAQARYEWAVACLDIHDRLAAGETVPDVAASVTPIGEPEWRIPNRPSVEKKATDLEPGDLIEGEYDRGMGTQLWRHFVGPVATVSEPKNRYERGTWVTITLADGTDREVQTHRWYAVHPKGTW